MFAFGTDTVSPFYIFVVTNLVEKTDYSSGKVHCKGPSTRIDYQASDDTNVHEYL